MGRILFLGAVAFIAFKYIARSNQRHLKGGPTPERQALRSSAGPELDVTPEDSSASDARALPVAQTSAVSRPD